MTSPYGLSDLKRIARRALKVARQVGAREVVPNRVAIVVRQGIVNDVYVSDRKAVVEVIDLDTDDADAYDSGKARIEQLNAEVAANTMVTCEGL